MLISSTVLALSLGLVSVKLVQSLRTRRSSSSSSSSLWRCSRNCIGCECPCVWPSGWQFLLTDVSTTWRHITSLPSSNMRAMLVTDSIYARRHWPCSMLLAPNTTIGGRAFSSTAAHVWNSLPTVVQSSESLDIFDAAWKLNCSSVLTTDTAPVKRFYCCVTHFHFPAAFCCGRNLEVYQYNVAMTFILNNNNNNCCHYICIACGVQWFAK